MPNLSEPIKTMVSCITLVVASFLVGLFFMITLYNEL
ncbi:hypothetical protein J3E07_001662 [Methanococcus voltae]|uniref:Uncharacterized protein n=1 Tax=Methanococcus voltae TaxID=2188 RepID=A0A8J7RNM0_METVO|nr:hypothetical protein [Methanococcus voltae]